MYSKSMTVEEMCRRLRPLFGKKIDQLYLKYVMTDNRITKNEIEQAINALYQKHLTDSLLNEDLLLEPPKKEVITGTYPLGTVLYGEKELHSFDLREKDWMRHMCITGMSGSGKTTFAFQVLGNFIFKKKPFLVFDWKKSFRPLSKLNEKMHIYTVGNENVNNFKLNINKPPKGVNPKEWINLLADIITETFSASFGVHKLLVETLDKAYHEFGVFAGSENYPTWYQIRDRLEERAANQTRKSRESEWLESALRIAYAITFGNFGKTVCYKGQNDSNIEELFKEQTVMELASLSNTEKKFFTQYILSYIYKWAKAGGVNTTEEFKYAILVDEAHNIFLKDKPNFISESIADVIFREIREYGVSLITLDQHISKLSDVVSGNSATNIAFQQMLPQDIEAVSRLMQLHDHKEYFTKLPVGGAIVKLVERYHQPFIIKAPLMKLKSMGVTDEELHERMKLLLKNTKRRELFKKSVTDSELAKKIQKMEYTFINAGVKTDKEFLTEQVRLKEAQTAARKAQEAHNKTVKDGPAGFGIKNHIQQKVLDDARKRLLNGESMANIKKWYQSSGHPKSDVLFVWKYMKRKGIIEKLEHKNVAVQEEEIKLNEEEKHFLQTIKKHPKLSVSAAYKEAGLSPRKGNELKNKLEEAGVIEITEQKNEKGWSKHITICYTDDLTKQLTD